MSYTRVNWNSTTTYVSAENLNVMDKGIKDLDTNIGDVTTLTTTAKTVVPAIKELKTGLEALNNNLQWVKSGNWEYQKLDNGTLRIKLRIDVVLDINTPTGSLFYCPSSPSNYPVAFIEPPTITVTLENTFGAWCTPYSLGTATSTPAFIFFLTVSILQLTGKFNLIAEGRWK